MADEGFLDWVFKRSYDNERELLRAMLRHAESWYNEITTPLRGLLYAFEMGHDFPDVDAYSAIAREMYFRKIEVNHGNYLRDAVEQMNRSGINLFASRHELQKCIQEFLNSGNFVKDIVILDSRTFLRHNEFYRTEIGRGWKRFQVNKERLVAEINGQIRQLDVRLHELAKERLTEVGVISILFLSAEPSDASRLRLGEELREIQEKLQLAKLRDRFALHQRMSVRPADISQALLDVQPQIVHFSGHGTATGALCVENELGQTITVQPDALAALVEQFEDHVDCVILNACYSEAQANAIARHTKYVIGMNQAIGDDAAIAFAVGFYQALGAGRTIEDAYQLGCVQVRLRSIPGHLTPILIKKQQTNVQRSTQGTGLLARFEAVDNRTGAPQAPRVDHIDGLTVLDFDAARDQVAEFSGVLSPAYRGSGVIIKIHHSMSSASSGVVRWLVSMRRNLAEDRGRAFSAPKSISRYVPKIHLDDTAGELRLESGLEMDDVNAGDPFLLRLVREASHPDDTAPGDAQFIAVEIFEATS